MAVALEASPSRFPPDGKTTATPVLVPVTLSVCQRGPRARLGAGTPTTDDHYGCVDHRL